MYFLCTRLKCPTEEDWGKLRRVLKYLKATKDDMRIMVSDDLPNLDTCIYAFHAIHEDMRENAGRCMSCRVGIIHGKA